MSDGLLPGFLRTVGNFFPFVLFLTFVVASGSNRGIAADRLNRNQTRSARRGDVGRTMKKLRVPPPPGIPKQRHNRHNFTFVEVAMILSR